MENRLVSASEKVIIKTPSASEIRKGVSNCNLIFFDSYLCKGNLGSSLLNFKFKFHFQESEALASNDVDIDFHNAIYL